MKKIAKNRQGMEEVVESRGQLLGRFIQRELREFVVTAGMAALDELLEEERTALCGPRYAHRADRTAHRAGHAPGELVLGGRRVRVSRPRVRTADGEELSLPSWTAFSREDPLHERVLEQMMIGVSTRRYERSLETIPDSTPTRGMSKSAVSRRFVRTTEAMVSSWLARRLDDLDLVALMLDGLHVEDHVVLVALGIDVQGVKHVLGLRLGATENATATTALLADLVERGMRADRPTLVVIDGAKALARAVRDVFGEHARIQRCQVHKMRNVVEHLPEAMKDSVRASMRQAYQTGEPKRAKKLLENLVRRLEADHPDAAGSLREGLDETLTVMGFGLPPKLERLLSNTNAIENLMGTAREKSARVKRWRDGTMIVRWMTAALHEASQRFRRVWAHDHLPKLVAAIRPNQRVAHPRHAA